MTAVSIAQTAPYVVHLGPHRYEILIAKSLDTVLDAFAEEHDHTLSSERCPFGMVLWPCSRAYASQFADIYAALPEKPLRILELGCGVGFLAGFVAQATKTPVVATDYEAGLSPVVLANSERLGAYGYVSFETLDWRKPIPEHLKGQFDLVIACDVLYDDAHVFNLPPIAKGLLRKGGALHLVDPRRYRFAAALTEIERHFKTVQVQTLPVTISERDLADGIVGLGYQFNEVSLIQALA